MTPVNLKHLDPPVLLPDGSEFKTWETPVKFTRTYYVDGSNPDACDDNPGTKGAPFRTINRAAQLLHPGERVVVRAGVYRECVRPLRGGAGPDRMISYQAEPGAEVIIKGSDILTGWVPSTGWRKPEGASGINIWKVELDPNLFKGYNPFAIINLPRLVAQRCFTPKPELMPKLLARRGLVFQGGRLLRQVTSYAELCETDGTYWAEPHGQVLHIRPFGDIDPNTDHFEITTREQAFAPKHHELGFTHVKGFTIEQVADGFPWPQRAALSTMRGHHWIIEDNTIRWVNALGIDIGRCEVDMDEPELCGYHIVRRNRVQDCGICGICGTGPLKDTLIEENYISRCGWHNVEEYFECAGIKTHHNHGCLLRRNVITDMLNASGIWMDFGNINSRCCENVIVNTDSIFGAIFVEASHLPNMVDSNFIWGSTSNGVYEHDCDYLTVAHNFIANAAGAGVMLRLGQPRRWVFGRGATGRKHRVLNNIITGCGTFIEFPNPDNYSQGNLLGDHREPAPLRIHLPEENHDLTSWRAFHGWDTNGAESVIKAVFDSKGLVLTWSVKGDIPTSERVGGISRDFSGNERSGDAVTPGPFIAVPGDAARICVDPRRGEKD